MKLGYFADGPWSHKAIERLVEDVNVEIVFIVPRYDTQDPVLRLWAKKLDIPYIPHPNVNSSEFKNLVDSFKADLFVSMSFNQILKKDILTLPRLGFINCHAGALPFYRGRNPLNWVLINDERSFGITVHYVDEGIDTGDIIEQQHYLISDQDDYGTLYLKAVNSCAIVLHSAIQKIYEDSVIPISQTSIHPVGTYFGCRTIGDEVVNFSWNARQFFNFIRAITTPGPGGRCFIKGKEIAILKTEMIENAPCYMSTCGEIVGRSEKGSIVKVGDTTMLLTAVAEVNNNILGEVFIPAYRIGTRFDKNEC